MQFVPLDNIERLWACYLTAKRDPAVIEQEGDKVVVVDVDIIAPEPGTITAMFQSAQLFPIDLMDEYKKDPHNRAAQEALFRHLTNRAASRHWHRSEEQLLPAAFLDVAVSEDQRKLMSPTLRDVLFANLEQDSYGAGATKKHARRRQDMLDGNTKSYARCLNCPDCLASLADYNSMQAALAVINAEQESKKKERKKQQEKKDAEQKKKKEKKDKEAAEKRAKVLPSLLEDIKKGEAHISSLGKPRLVDILLIVFGEKKADIAKLKKDELKGRVIEHLQDAPTDGNVNVLQH